MALTWTYKRAAVTGCTVFLALLAGCDQSSEKGLDQPTDSAAEAPAAGTSGDATTASGVKCETLWRERNEIAHRNGFCFKSEKAIATFGNEGCNASNPVYSPDEEKRVLEIKQQEKALKCSAGQHSSEEPKNFEGTSPASGPAGNWQQKVASSLGINGWARCVAADTIVAAYIVRGEPVPPSVVELHDAVAPVLGEARNVFLAQNLPASALDKLVTGNSMQFRNAQDPALAAFQTLDACTGQIAKAMK